MTNIKTPINKTSQDINRKHGVLNDEFLEPILQEMTALCKIFGRKKYAFVKELVS